MHNLDTWALIAFVFLLLPALAQASREWGAVPMLSWKHLWAARWIVCLLIGGVIFFWHQWSEQIGFNQDWPDAIYCQWQEPHMAKNQRTAFVFYLQTLNTPRSGLHDVTSYFMAGSCMVDVIERGTGRHLHDYTPHELWFDSQSRQLITPDKLPPDLDDFEFKYKACFMRDISCGGDTIDLIRKTGNAFTLARGAN